MIDFSDFSPDRRKWFFLGGGILCFIAAFALILTFGGRFAAAPTSELVDETEFAADSMLPETLPAAEKWAVYVSGAVMRPGVYEIAPGSRVVDALRAAGGFASLADPDAINLAAKVADGDHVKIPYREDATQQVASTSAASNSPATPRNLPSASPVHPPSQGKIDINRVGAEELRTLPGIGPGLSQAIVDYRFANGPFHAPEDLMKVRGIGAKRFAAMKDMIIARP